MNSFKYFFSIIFVVLFSIESSAVIMHGVSTPEEHREFAKDPRFDSVGVLIGQNNHCTAFLLDPRTIITAAHCFEDPVYDYQFILNVQGQVVSSNILTYNVYWHFLPYKFHYNDIAVATLSEPVFEVSPLSLHEASLGRSWEGTQLSLAGYGDLGIENHDFIFSSPKIKFAGYTQILNEIKFPDSSGDIEFFELVDPSFANKDQVLGLTSYYGDSGSPLILEENSTYKILGVNIYINMGDDPLFQERHEEIKKTFPEDLKVQQKKSFEELERYGYQKKNPKTPMHLSPIRRTGAVPIWRFGFFLKKNSGALKVYSHPEAQKWSDITRWTAELERNLPKKINNHEIDEVEKQRLGLYVTVRGKLEIDDVFRVDSLNFESNRSQASLRTRKFFTNLIRIHNGGTLSLGEGTLSSHGISVDSSGIVKGGHKIKLCPSHENHFKAIPDLKAETFWLKNGELDLRDNTYPLLIIGTYLQEKEGLLSVDLRHPKSELAKIIIDGTATLNQGTLRLVFHPQFDGSQDFESIHMSQRIFPDLPVPNIFTFSSSSALLLLPHLILNPLKTLSNFFEVRRKQYRWSLLKADKIKGNFGNIEHNLPKHKYNVDLEYNANNIDVLMTENF